MLVSQQKLEKALFCSSDGVKSLTLQKSAKNFITQWKVKKSQLCVRNLRNVPSTTEIKNKSTLQCLPLDFFFFFFEKQTESTYIKRKKISHDRSKVHK